MTYKELHSVEYYLPHWDDIEASFISKWKDEIRFEPWVYKADMEQSEATQKLIDEDAKFEFLNNWEASSTRSPLHHFFCDLNRTSFSSREEAFWYQSREKTYCMMDKMYDDYHDQCRASFIEVNMPSSDQDRHREHLAYMFDEKKLQGLPSMIENHFDEIFNTYFSLEKIRQLIKYKLPDSDLMLRLEDEFDKYLLTGKWKVINNSKLYIPESKHEFVTQFIDDGDSILNHIYVKSKYTLYHDIKTKSKERYRASFVELNTNPEITGTIRVDAHISEIEKHFELYYDDLAEQFSIDVLKLYDNFDIIKMFEANE